MHRKNKIGFFLLVLFGIVAVGLVWLYSDRIAVLNPQGIIGEKQRDLLMTSTLLMLIVVIPALVLPFAIVWKYRASNKKAKYTPNWDYHWLIESIWWGVPLVIILVLGVITWRSCHELDPFKPLDSEKKPVRIQAVALQWKWLFIYPDYQIATVNFIQFPEQTPINFEITADAPMNSFWIPELGGQVYAMSGMRSKLHLIANGPGTYRGVSANFSGRGFAGMSFTAKSSSQEEFDQWIASVKQSSNLLSLDQYKQLVRPSEYQSAATYTLADSKLFDWIIMKYMMPMEQGTEHVVPAS